MSCTVTGSIDEALFDQAPGALGILVRGGLRDAMPMIMEARSRAPLVPMYISCMKEDQAACAEILEACADIELIQELEASSPVRRVHDILWRSAFRRTMILFSDAELPPDPSALLSSWEDDQNVCRVPFFRDQTGDLLPAQVIPTLEKRTIRVRHIPPEEGLPLDTLLAWDYTGIYDTPLFRSIGGYELSFRSPYWQQIDFGTRCYLWGYRITFMPGFVMHTPRPLEVSTAKDHDYLRWYRRNCSLYRGSRGIKISRNLLRGEGSADGSWIREHFSRFIMSMDDLVRTWGEGP